jgi:hypothetical protein
MQEAAVETADDSTRMTGVSVMSALKEAAVETGLSSSGDAGADAGARPPSPSAMDLLSQLAMMDKGGTVDHGIVRAGHGVQEMDAMALMAEAARDSAYEDGDGDSAYEDGDGDKPFTAPYADDDFEEDGEGDGKGNGEAGGAGGAGRELQWGLDAHHDPGLRGRRVASMRERMAAMDALMETMDKQANGIDESYALLDRLQQRGGRKGYMKEAKREAKSRRERARVQAAGEYEEGRQCEEGGAAGGDREHGQTGVRDGANARGARHALLQQHLDNLEGEMHSSKYLLAQLEQQLGTGARSPSRRNAPRSPSAVAHNAINTDIASARQLLDALRAETGQEQ